VPLFRNTTLECLTEIGSLNIGKEHDQQFEKLYIQTMAALRSFLPPQAGSLNLLAASHVSVDIAQAYEGGSAEDQKFIQHLSLFLSGFFKSHPALMEKTEYHSLLLEGHKYVVTSCRISTLC
jgi:exportin-1